MEAACTEETNIYAFQSCNKSNNNRTYRVTFKIFEAKAINYLISMIPKAISMHLKAINRLVPSIKPSVGLFYLCFSVKGTSYTKI